MHTVINKTQKYSCTVTHKCDSYTVLHKLTDIYKLTHTQRHEVDTRTPLCTAHTETRCRHEEQNTVMVTTA